MLDGFYPCVSHGVDLQAYTLLFAGLGYNTPITLEQVGLLLPTLFPKCATVEISGSESALFEAQREPEYSGIVYGRGYALHYGSDNTIVFLIPGQSDQGSITVLTRGTVFPSIVQACSMQLIVGMQLFLYKRLDQSNHTVTQILSVSIPFLVDFARKNKESLARQMAGHFS